MQSTRRLTIRDEAIRFEKSVESSGDLTNRPQGRRRENGLLKRRRSRGIIMRIRTRCQRVSKYDRFSFVQTARLGPTRCADPKTRHSSARDLPPCAPGTARLKNFTPWGARLPSLQRTDRIPRRIITRGRAGSFGKLNSRP